jgi:mono/diheme cytochrome c family protein
MRNFYAVMTVMLLAPVAAWAQQNTAQIAQGEKVYVAQKCAACHSIAAKGNQKGPLDDVGGRLSAEDIRLWIVSATEMTAKTKAVRKPPMKSYVIPKDDLDALVVYMQSLKKKS